MKVFIDSNILISAALNSRGVPYQAFLKAVSYPNKGIISVQNLEANIKFPIIITASEFLNM